MSQYNDLVMTLLEKKDKINVRISVAEHEAAKKAKEKEVIRAALAEQGVIVTDENVDGLVQEYTVLLNNAISKLEEDITNAEKILDDISQS